MNLVSSLGMEHSDEVQQERLPHSEFNFMEEVDGQHLMVIKVQLGEGC